MTADDRTQREEEKGTKGERRTGKKHQRSEENPYSLRLSDFHALNPLKTLQALKPSIQDALNDLQSLQTHVATQNQREKAEVLLETMSHRQIMANIGALVLSFLISLVFTIVFAVTAKEIEEKIQDIAFEKLIKTDVALRTLSFILLLGFIVRFTWFIIIEAIKSRTVMLGEQALVICVSMMLLCGPGFGIYFLVALFIHYKDLLSFSTLNLELSGTIHVEDVSPNGLSGAFINPLGTFYSEIEVIGSTVASLIGLCVFYMLHLLMKSVLCSENLSKAVADSSSSNEVKSCSRLKHFIWKLYRFVFTEFANVSAPMKEMYFMATLYFSSVLTTSIVFDFVPSAIPFVGIITLLKVCIADTDELRMFAEEVDIQFMFPERNESLCRHPVVLRRVISQLCVFLIETCALWFSFSVSKKSRRRLKLLPYQSNRSRHLGYEYYSLAMTIMFFSVVLLSVILVSTPSFSWWTIRIRIEDQEMRGSKYEIDPLHVIGMPPESVGFGVIYLLFAVTMICLGSAYSSPSRRGLKEQIFDALEKFHLKSTKTISTAALYFCREEEAHRYYRNLRQRPRGERLRVQMKRADSAPRKKSARMSLNPKSEISSSMRFINQRSQEKGWEESMQRAKDIVEKKTSVPTIIGGVVVFETIVQLFCLTHLVYDLSEEFEQDLKHDIKTSFLPDSSVIADGSGMKSNTSTVRQCSCRRKKKQRKATTGFGADQHRSTSSEEKEEKEEKEIDLEKSTGIAHRSFPIPRLSEDDAETLVYDLRSWDCTEFTGPITDISFVFYVLNKTWDSHCLIAAAEDRICVSFRGTISRVNVSTDLDYALVPYLLESTVLKSIDKQSPQSIGGKPMIFVHQGFQKALSSFEKTLLSCIDELLEEAPCRSIFCTGHSLGGALAVLFSLSMKLQINKSFFSNSSVPVSCYTFGSPMVGNYRFKKVFLELIPASYRIVFVGDVVCSLPPSNGYRHAGMRILLDQNGNLLLNPSFVERVLYSALRGYQVEPHFKGIYSLGLMCWCARTHGEDFIPNWWLPVINHLYSWYANKVNLVPDSIRPLVLLQLNKANALYVVDKKVYRHAAVQTDTFHEPLGEIAKLVRFTQENGKNSVTSHLDLLITVMSQLDELFTVTDCETYRKAFMTQGFASNIALSVLEEKDLEVVGILLQGQKRVIINILESISRSSTMVEQD